MYIVCHYGEIALKGGNRKMFEEKLVENIKKALKTNGVVFQLVRRLYGRILIKFNDAAEAEKAEKPLKKVFGLAYFYLAWACPLDLELIKKTAGGILAHLDFETFCVRTKRANKGFPLTSQEINEQVGAYIAESLKKEVDLESADVVLMIEITDQEAFLGTAKIIGLGGLPVGVSGKAVCLLSGGIDSPVASYYAMKRGVEVIFLHFHSFPYTDQASIAKVSDLASVLKKFQGQAAVYLVPFADIQKEVLLKTKADLRVILYRRLMLKIAQKIAQAEQAEVLITGESIGQVASQTLPNITAIAEASSLLVLRPLIGFDKQEIIAKAQEIGTYEVSIVQHQDCCSRFLPQFPETKADLAEVKNEEKNLKSAKLIKEALKNLKVVNI
ncbi:MAG: tRNA 4-thiouridine(8) synthase ThiI [Candidatus Pacebacteria bacterium]|nr:tRNA 4-thiouridine(8) synthase ThiI [Candidatus Paceibacterota bacterium]